MSNCHQGKVQREKSKQLFNRLQLDCLVCLRRLFASHPNQSCRDNPPETSSLLSDIHTSANMSQKQACIFLKGASRRQRTLTHEEVEELREAFVEFDKDKDGFITCKDLGNLMRTMGYMPTEMELIQLSQNINMNLGGRVDFEDFLELMTPKLLAETAGMIGLKELKEAFREFDIDGDGCITSDELRHAMVKLLGAQTSKKEIDAVVREADRNGDGTVDFEEFVRMKSQK
ncbi:calcium-binding protein 5-like isoform X2 [Nerophis ophidion]|uniref:calcium-binding protein 5-like isoform X2 n=1 Tax=Nerophis ophidion TaxID=159077 RepID=UPI002AE09C32|nr:calcium-binding protein 5-like isoform X2 [Nerophis ophidion]